VIENDARIAIVGLGTVGSGVAEILTQHADRMRRHAGKSMQLARVVVRDASKPLRYPVDSKLVTDDIESLIEDRDIDVVAQLIGGLEPARTIMLRLLESGKDIVTANKALLAEHGPELFDRARDLGRSIAFEASVAGGVPIISNLSQCLSANQVTSLRGILNGTSNFIVSQMEEQGQSYERAVRLAQEKGFAEADPTMDVDGTDAAQKLAILAHLTCGAHVDWRKIPRVGIDQLQPSDLNWAGELGYRIKLLAVAKLNDDQHVELHVSPTLVKMGTPLAEVRGANNAISALGDMLGRAFFHGLGAGRLPTASAVVADLIDTVIGRASLTFRTLDLWSENRPPAVMADPAKTHGRFYLRFSVEDHPGVLAKITSCLGDHQISITSVIQPEHPEISDASEDTGTVSLVIMTHSAAEGQLKAALEQLNKLDVMRAKSVSMRVLD